jgi:hypothetical protein
MAENISVEQAQCYFLINLLNKELLKVLCKTLHNIRRLHPTFPAIAAISGVKKNKFPCSSIPFK